jgi:hypothetical protein
MKALTLCLLLSGCVASGQSTHVHGEGCDTLTVTHSEDAEELTVP